MVDERDTQLLAVDSFWWWRSRWFIAARLPLASLSCGRPLGGVAEVVMRCRAIVPEPTTVEMVADRTAIWRGGCQPAEEDDQPDDYSERDEQTGQRSKSYYHCLKLCMPIRVRKRPGHGGHGEQHLHTLADTNWPMTLCSASRSPLLASVTSVSKSFPILSLLLLAIPSALAAQVAPTREDSLARARRDSARTLAGVTVSATRSERRIENDPVRVERLDAEEVVEKLLMTPGDITMMLNETSGLRVQVTSPSLGGASVRVQGLRGRYTQILSDGLPLYGGQTGGLGLLQIPPMDLGGVEVIKGVASALYGGTALGGVVNLLSRRPGEEPIRELLLNQTSLGGTDAVAFLGGSSSSLGYTLLGGLHGQDQRDRDADAWTDLPGYSRGVLRPRLFWNSENGSSAMLTAGTTFESRNGGTMPDSLAPNGQPYPERLRTRRFDVGGTYRGLFGTGLVNVRGAFSSQRHRHVFGQMLERDEHKTSFAEAAYTRAVGARTWVVGAALLAESYDAQDIDGFDFSFTTPGIFAQLTTDIGAKLSVTTSLRGDWHSEYGSFVSPRMSALVRLAEPWTLRASLGSGFFAPTPFTEETEVVGLSAMRPLAGVSAERAVGGSVDLGGQVGSVELNLTAFASRIRDPIGVRDAFTAVPRVEVINLGSPTRTTGGELLARWHADPLRLTFTYTHVRSTEADPESGLRRPSPLSPRHQAGLVASYEREGEMRAGVEIYYTGRQSLDDDAYRVQSKPYLHIGVMAERRFGMARLFVNAENLLNMKQTDYDPLVRPFMGRGGRWTNDVWAPLDGFVMNAGIRLSLSGSD
jgi:outer membrane receptor for ferrienterochelin and colicins